MADQASLHWDAGSTGISECNVANAAVGASGVVLSFGRKERDPATGVWHVGQAHQVVLAADAAASLRQMLVRMLADAEPPGQ
jgi:hypothetical protein